MQRMTPSGAPTRLSSRAAIAPAQVRSDIRRPRTVADFFTARRRGKTADLALRALRGLRGLRAVLACGVLCGALPLAASRAGAQGSARGASDQVSQTAPSSRDSIAKPMLLLLLRRPSAAPLGRNDVNLLLAAILHEALTSRYMVVDLKATQPLIRRALNERIIATTDLEEPISDDAARRVALAIGARDLLVFSSVFADGTMNTSAQYQEQAGQQDWIVRVSQEFSTPGVVRKRRLKPQDLVNIAVDRIASMLNVPSSRAGNLRILDQPPVAARAGKAPKTKAGSSPADATSVGQRTPVAKDTARTDAPGTAAPSADRSPRAANAGDGDAPSISRGAPAAPAAPITQPSGPPQSEVGGPAAPAAQSTPVATKADYETEAASYRQAGDLANCIRALRRAINDRPRDIGLRRQLIQAYNDRQLFDAALGEEKRALALKANDADLVRLYGDALLGRGDTAGAMKAYRDAIRRDPKDVLAYVALGSALLADNQYTEACATYMDAAGADPHSPLPHRRLARALAGRAASDTAQYAASLDQIQQARALTPPTDQESYTADYIAIMGLMDTRLHEMLLQLQDLQQSQAVGRITASEVDRKAQEMRSRATSAADYLDKLPPAAGQDTTHLEYQQASAFVLQAINLFREYIGKGSPELESQMLSAHLDATRALDAAKKRLTPTHPQAAGGA